MPREYTPPREYAPPTGRLICNTIGELRALIADLPDEMELDIYDRKDPAKDLVIMAATVQRAAIEDRTVFATPSGESSPRAVGKERASYSGSLALQLG